MDIKKMRQLAGLEPTLPSLTEASEQQKRDAESVKKYGVKWRETKSGHTIGIDPDSGAITKGNPHVKAATKQKGGEAAPEDFDWGHSEIYKDPDDGSLTLKWIGKLTGLTDYRGDPVKQGSKLGLKVSQQFKKRKGWPKNWPSKPDVALDLGKGALVWTKSKLLRIHMDPGATEKDLVAAVKKVREATKKAKAIIAKEDAEAEARAKKWKK